uniref:TNF receptor-associated factor 6 n=1 Tax=Timema cristinae TaxID=61476 RepID=A0A7R9CSN5_TIMCR|nr:unnamed protein product [Timema cristinae]
MSSHRVNCAQESAIPSLEGEDKLEARFECPICLQCLKEPILTPCGHRFCNSCIHEWLLKPEGGSCPIDNHPLSEEKDLFPDNFTRREIEDLEPHASKACHNRKESSELEECSFKDIGCTVVLTKTELARHLEDDIHHHLSLLTLSFSKLTNSVEKQNIDVKAQEAANFWEPDEKGQPTQNGNDPPHQWQSLVRSLYERIVMLEQRNREQDIQLENIKHQFSTKTEKISQDLSLRYCGGTYIWSVNRFSVKLAEMVAKPSQCMLYSPGFYTTPSGYKFCIRINLSPTNHNYLALLVHLMRGENDAFIEWPFTGRISVMLANTNSYHEHLRETMMSRPELRAFRRPLHDINPLGFGYTEFISLSDLTSFDFISNDSLTIKVCVKSV